MKRNKIFIVIALVLVGLFAFAACTPKTTAQSEATKDEMSQQETATDATIEKEEEMMEEAEKEDTMDNSKEFMGDAYNFDLMDIEGNTYKLSDLQGKKVYIKFWASWCSICLAGISEFEELYAEHVEDDDVVILTIASPGASGEVSLDKFKSWFTTEGYAFKVLMDEDGPVQREYGIRGFPTSVFIDTTGNVYETKIGHVDNEAINSILSDMP